MQAPVILRDRGCFLLCCSYEKRQKGGRSARRAAADPFGEAAFRRGKGLRSAQGEGRRERAPQARAALRAPAGALQKVKKKSLCRPSGRRGIVLFCFFGFGRGQLDGHRGEEFL